MGQKVLDAPGSTASTGYPFRIGSFSQQTLDGHAMCVSGSVLGGSKETNIRSTV